MRLPPLLLALAAPALAQEHPAVVVRMGDPVGALGNIDNIYDVDCNTQGDTLVSVHVDNPDNNTARALLKNGAPLVVAGMTAPGVGGTFTIFTTPDLDDNGVVTVLTSVLNAPGKPGISKVLYHGQTPSLAQGDAYGGTGFHAGTTYKNLHSCVVDDTHKVIVVADLDDPVDGIQKALVLLVLNGAGAVQNELLIMREGVVPPGQTHPVQGFWLGTGMTAINNLGQFVWAATLDAAAAPHDNVSYFGANLHFQSFTPSPVAGYDWEDLPPVCDVNDAGQVVLFGDLDSASVADDAVIVLDGAVVLQEGDTGPLGHTVASLGQGSIDLTEDGQVGYYCLSLVGDPTIDESLFLDNLAFAREGITETMDGELLTGIEDIDGSYDFSDDGRFCVYVGTLDGTTDAVLLAEHIDATLYCSVAANSTGSIALTQVLGGSTSTQYDKLWLHGLGMPPGQFGYGLTSLTQADVIPPGSEGHLCLGGQVGRFADQVAAVAPNGTLPFFVDLEDLPVGTGVAVLPGETWNFQLWYRDANPGPTSNFTRPIAITFR